MDSLNVYLHGVFVGKILRLNDGRIEFLLDEEFRLEKNHYTLSRSFIQADGEVRNSEKPASSGQVPSFFSNLLPEGALRTYLAKIAGVTEHREFELLELLGADLPGAVEVRRHDVASSNVPALTPLEANSYKPLRFSLAGVQLKFSAIEKAAGGLTIPAQGIGGDWIVKLPSTRFARVPENEFSMMSIAGAVGIAIPEIKLTPMAEIEGLPSEVTNLGEANALVIKRFDRVSGRRIHIEDFAQVLSQRPFDKYNPQINYTHLTQLVSGVTTESCVLDFARRLMVNAITGNGDMHLKNWSFIYPDGRTPELSPAYDLLCTTIYIPEDGLALKLGKARRWQDLTLDDFGKVAEGAGLDQQLFVEAAVDTVEKFQVIWPDQARSLPMSEDLVASIGKQLNSCPAISHAWRK